MIVFIFWMMAALIVYCYLGYPLVIFLVAKCFSRAVKKASIEPTITVVLSVYNEKAVMQQKIENLLGLDYPENKMEIFIGSDGSDDSTAEIIKKFKNDRLHFKENRQRRGKMVTLNELVKASNADIIVFTDARQVFDKSAIRELVANFADARVGCVSGELIFSRKDEATAKGINVYWEYEKFIRDQESRVHSMLGATGAIYAIRRELFVEIPKDTILDDMFVPLEIIKKGYRAIIDRSAKAFDQVAGHPKEEHRRKARTLYGNYQLFFKLPSVFIPFLSPIAFQMFSHKLLRVGAPFLLIMIFVFNLFLVDNPVYFFLFLMQAMFYLMAILGWWGRSQKDGFLKKISKVCYLPYVFCLLNFSALVGLMRFIMRKQDVMWKKAKEGSYEDEEI